MTFKELQEKYGRPILHNSHAGITRAMFYNSDASDVRIYVEDSGTKFVLNPPVFLAIDAWKNPRVYADAALRGIDNPRRLVPADMGRIAA